MADKMVKLGKKEVSYNQFRHDPPPPGPDLDALVFEAMGGVLGCNGWEAMNLGSAGGPVLRKTTCPHAHGACASVEVIRSIHGTIGGVPDYSTRIPVPLEDLPSLWKIYRINELCFVSFDEAPITGKNEVHVRALAYLAARSWGCVEQKWTDENRFDLDGTKYSATALGLPWPLPAPWTPETVAKAARIAHGAGEGPPWGPDLTETEQLRQELTAGGITPEMYAATVTMAIEKKLKYREDLQEYVLQRMS